MATKYTKEQVDTLHKNIKSELKKVIKNPDFTVSYRITNSGVFDYACFRHENDNGRIEISFSMNYDEVLEESYGMIVSIHQVFYRSEKPTYYQKVLVDDMSLFDDIKKRRKKDFVKQKLTDDIKDYQRISNFNKVLELYNESVRNKTK